jgi:gliding motility-associated lipoprotein GldH
MHRLKFIFTLMAAFILLLTACTNSSLVDTNMSLPENSWSYAKSAKAVIAVKDVAKSYNIYFKLRHTADYRYANMYILMHLKGDSLQKDNRFQFKLAKADGEWLGKGSGDIFTYNFSLLTNYRFAKPGNYEIELEQNMRDNPLIGVSDVGITVTTNE